MKAYIRQALGWNSYTRWLLEGADTPPPDQPVEEAVSENLPDLAPDQAGPRVHTENITVEPPDLEETKKRYPVAIPYMKGVSGQVRIVMKGYRLKVYIKPTNTIRQILVHPKDKVIKERVVCPVTHISYDNSDNSYLGETGRSPKARFMEHRRPRSVNSDVSKHINCDKPGHTISLDNVRIWGV